MQDIRPKYWNIWDYIYPRTQNRKMFTPFMLFAGEIRDQVYSIRYKKGNSRFTKWYIHWKRNWNRFKMGKTKPGTEKRVGKASTSGAYKKGKAIIFCILKIINSGFRIQNQTIVLISHPRRSIREIQQHQNNHVHPSCSFVMRKGRYWKKIIPIYLSQNV